MENISPEYLRERLIYDASTGKLFWRDDHRMPPQWRSRYAGKEAFTSIGNHGYHHGSILKNGLLAHRVIWAMETGSWPTGQIDHADTIRTNNKFPNLRAATPTQNSRNKGALIPAKSGIVGVLWDNRRQRWHGRITIHGKTFVAGYSKDIAVAISARDSLLREHGFDPKHGKHYASPRSEYHVGRV